MDALEAVAVFGDGAEEGVQAGCDGFDLDRLGEGYELGGLVLWGVFGCWFHDCDFSYMFV